MMMKKLLMISAIMFSVCCFGLTQQSESPTQKQKEILSDFSNYMLQHKKPPYGITAFSAVAQCKENSPIAVYGGTTDTKGKIPIDENSLFHIGSVTKSFISVVMLQVAQAYKIDLDSDKVISHYFPQYPKWGKVTVRQLLNMTSGIHTYYDGLSNDVMKKITSCEFKHYIAPETILNLVYKLPMDFKPGKGYEYSNTNYTLLGVLIQKITHQTFQSEVKKRIIDKLGMHHTYFPVNKLEDMSDVDKSEIVHCYSYFNSRHSPYSFVKYGQDTINFSDSAGNSAGGMVSTPSDINIYLHALYKPGVLLTQSQFKQFTTLVSTENGKVFSPEKHSNAWGYGLGIFGYYSKSQHHLIYFYQGEMGCQTIYFYNPGTQMYVTYAFNTMFHIINKNNYRVLMGKLNKTC